MPNLSLRGPDVLFFLAIVAYSDGSTHVKKELKK